jgi:hypothetical protein
MKNCWLLVGVAGLLSLMSLAQTVNGSASGNASVSPGQVDSSAKASQNTQAAGASANANASAQGQVDTDHKAKPRSKAGGGASRNSAGSPGGTGSSAVLAGGSTLSAELTHSLEAKSCKPGDQVTARLTEDVKSDGKVVVPKGSKLVGHVTEAKARSKDNADSRLGIVFDRAVLKSGQELSFNGAVQALAPPVSAALSAAGDESISAAGPSGGGGPRRSGGGGLLGGATSTVGAATSTTTGVVGGATGTVSSATTGAVNGTTGLAGGLTAQGRLTNASQGAIGLQGLSLNSATAGAAQGSVVSSTTRNVKLESGTQMLLKVTSSAQ